MSWFLASTFGRAAVFYVDLISALVEKALYMFEDDDDE